MSPDYLYGVGEELVKKYKTRDPFVIARELGIHVKFVENLKTLKGFYRVIKRNRWIFINNDLSPKMKRIVCAHELGHDRLHRAMAQDRGLMEFVLYDMQSRREYEANVVAAEILLPDEEILDCIYTARYDAEQIAEALDSDVNLVALKVAHLARKGYSLTPPEQKANFLKQ